MAGDERTASGSPPTAGGGQQQRRREAVDSLAGGRRHLSGDAEVQAVMQQLKQQLQAERLARREAERERLKLQKELETGSLDGEDRGEERGRRGEGSSAHRGGGSSAAANGGAAGNGKYKQAAAPRHAPEVAYGGPRAGGDAMAKYTETELERKLHLLKEELAEKDLCLRAERKGRVAARKFKDGAVGLIEKAAQREAEVEETRQQLQELLQADRSAWAAQEKKSEQNMLLLRKEIFQLTNALYVERRSNQRLTEQLLREQEMKDYAVKFITKRAKQTARTDDPMLWFRK